MKQDLITTHSSLISDTIGQSGHDRTVWTNRTNRFQISNFAVGWPARKNRWDSGTLGQSCANCGIRLTSLVTRFSATAPQSATSFEKSVGHTLRNSLTAMDAMSCMSQNRVGQAWDTWDKPAAAILVSAGKNVELSVLNYCNFRFSEKT